jgi:molecular chaperone HtpG
MFIPSHRPLDWMMGPPPKSGLDLYVKRVLIQHQSEELLPPYLRFIKGVVDSSDLPLNVSRETLQHNPLLARIKSNLVNRVLKTLDEIKTGERETYEKFFAQFGEVLKEGVGLDFANRERIADLLLLESTKTEPGKHTTLEQYLAGMTADQKEIYYLIGENRALIENSPYLEAFKAKGQEVILLSDPVDEYVVSNLPEYKGKRLKAADKGDVPSDDSAEQKQKAEHFKPLLETLKQRLGADVKDVRLSHRLKESAACLVADEYGPTAHMERLMHRLGQAETPMGFKRILELNPEHSVVQKLRQLRESNAEDPKIETYARLLLDEATIAEGSTIKDPAAFARRVNELIAGG